MSRRPHALRTSVQTPSARLLVLIALLAGSCGGAVGAAEAEPLATAPIDPRWSNLSAYNARRSSTSDAQGVRDGFLTLWHDNGVKQGEGQYEAGKKQGPWTWWFANGQKRWEGSYLLDSPEGFERGWYENGVLEYEGNFVSGQRSGPYTRWYDTGRLELRGEYRDGRREGEFRYWNYDGSLDGERSGLYADDQKTADLAEVGSAG